MYKDTYIYMHTHTERQRQGDRVPKCNKMITIVECR